MRHIQGEDRYQYNMTPMTFDDHIGDDNICRVIDAFVDSLDLVTLDFKYAQPKSLGRRPFNPADMLKLYIYGYQFKIRSSRRLQSETTRNIEVMWLLNGLTPDDKTISNFRTDNSKALKKVFREFVKFCSELNLYGKETVSIDGSKFKANNSRKNYHTEDSVNKQIGKIDKLITEYMNELENNDAKEADEPCLNEEVVKQAIEILEKQKVEKEELLVRIKENDGKGITTIDEDSTLMKLSGGKGYEVGHNVQTSVDEAHGMIVEFKASSNGNDLSELSGMVEVTLEMLEVEKINALADVGYCSGKEIAKSTELGATCYVPKPEPSHQPKDENYNRKNFKYDEKEKCYICPAGETFPLVRVREGDGYEVYANRQACGKCPVKKLCTKSKTLREIERSPNQAAIDNASENVKQNPGLYRRRQELSEYPFGVVKRIWGYDQFLCRGREKVEGELSLTFLAFNMRRAINILGIEKMIKAIKERSLIFAKLANYLSNWVFIIRRIVKTPFVEAGRTL
jgi:transposase